MQQLQPVTAITDNCDTEATTLQWPMMQQVICRSHPVH